MTKIVLLLFFASIKLTTLLGQNIFEKISNKTWFESNGFGGVTVVYLKTENGQIKALRQINGSGIPVVFTETYNVEIKQDTIFLKSSRETTVDKENIFYVYNESLGLLKKDTLLMKLFNEPIIYVSTEKGGTLNKQLNVRQLNKISVLRNELLANDSVYFLNREIEK